MNEIFLERPTTFKLLFLGCRVNQYEVQSYRSQLVSVGLSEVCEEEKPADLCVINTCAVTGSAESSSRNMVRRVLKRNPQARVIVTGCFVESDQDFFQGLERCMVIPNKSKSNLVGILFPEANKVVSDMRPVKDRSRIFIKVQDGCNSFCSYCIIPYLRGRSVSRDFKEILEEISSAAKGGYAEVVVTGINVGDYCFKDWDLAALIRAVDQVEGISRIRISSIDPEDVTENLIEAILEGRNTCPSLHLVLQSGSNGILKRMNRKYCRQDFLDKVERFRSVNPGFSFTTDVIVGFPGETDADFEDTLNTIRRVGFTKVHIFPYSPRKRTKAFDFSGTVVDTVIKERKNLLNQVAEETAFLMRERVIGHKTTVLVESRDLGLCSGHSPEFMKITFFGDASPGQCVPVLICENSSKGLFGEVL